MGRERISIPASLCLFSPLPTFFSAHRCAGGGEGEISAYKGRVQELARASHFWAESPVPRGMQTGCTQAREGRATQDP